MYVVDLQFPLTQSVISLTGNAFYVKRTLPLHHDLVVLSVGNTTNSDSPNLGFSVASLSIVVMFVFCLEPFQSLLGYLIRFV